ncbi:MAG: three-Cys-motif partner protein TcmP [Chitinivibrionales bacterium]|nr:three-Cys-motif partner protein TcmP [Chitinivibrionales bacterium]
MTIENDGLQLPEVGIWAKEKYDLVQTYCTLFTGSMKPPKWQSLVYIDLFAGAGYAKIKETSEIVTTSALRAIDIPHRFDKYIFCDINDQNSSALQKRVAQHYPEVDSHFICCDSNNAVPDILNKLPAHSKDFKVLTFCFVDPFKLDNLAFSTIEQLSKRFMDFLVLVPTDMDANRNVTPYMAQTNNTVERFIGKPDWRDRWALAGNKQFGLFILEEFSAHMQELDYKPQQPGETVLVRNYQKNAPLYRLAFYSRHDLGKKFWKETKKQNDPQISFLD